MTELTAQQETDYRTEPYAVDSYIYISQPNTVFAAQVNGEGTYPATSIIFDNVTTGAFGDIVDGMTLCIGTSPGAYDLGIQRVNSATSTVITIPRTSVGTGIGELTIADDAYITVLKDYRIHPKIPYIDDDGVQYKDGTAWSDLGNAEDAQPPVANCGPDRLFIVASASATQSVDFSGSGVAIESGSSISSYLWDVDDGTITVGVDTDSSITVEFTNTGERYVSLTVTDSNSNTHTARCLIVLAEESDCIDANVGRESITPGGIQWEFEVFGADLPAGFLPGSQFLYAQTEYWGTSSGQIVGNETRFSGWMSVDTGSVEATDDGNLLQSVTVQAVDVAGRLRELPGFPLAVDKAVTPTNWYEMAAPTPDRMIHHILYWHSTALERADYSQSGSNSTYPFVGFETQQGSLWDQCSYIANAIAFQMTCTTSGKIKVVGDPMIQPTSAQASALSLTYSRTTTVRTTLDEGDYTRLVVDDRRAPQNHWLWAEAILASSGSGIAPVFCVAPGLTPGQGVGSQSLTKQIAENVSEFLARAGHHYAARVNPSTGQIQLDLVHGGWVWEPADMEWLQVTLSSTYQAQNGLTFSSQKALILEVSNTYDFERGSKSSALTLEPEITGALATEYEKPEPQQLSELVFDPIVFPTFDITFDDFNIPVYTEPLLDPAIDLPKGTGVIGMMVDVLTFGAHHLYTSTFGSGSSTTWTATDLSATITDAILDVIVDPNDTTSMIVVTESAIFRVSGAATNSPSASSIHTFAYTSSDGRKIAWSLADPLFLAVSSTYTTTETGGARGDVFVDYTTDGGSTWNNINVTNTLSQGYSDTSIPMGIFLSDVNPGEGWLWIWTGLSSGNGMPARLAYTDDYFATVSMDSFFGTVQTASYFNLYQNGSRFSVYPYTWQKQAIPKFYYEGNENFGGTSTVKMRDGATGNDTTPLYNADVNTRNTQRERRVLSTSFINSAIGAKLYGSASVHTSKSLPGSWQTEGSDSSFGWTGLHMSSDHRAIYVYGNKSISLSEDFGVTYEFNWGDASTALGTTNNSYIKGLIGG